MGRVMNLSGRVMPLGVVMNLGRVVNIGTVVSLGRVGGKPRGQATSIGTKR